MVCTIILHVFFSFSLFKVSHKKPLEDYVSEHFPKNLIKIYRHYGEDQLGLIKGRLLGIKMASGEVVVCMDAHMELQPRW